MYNCIVVLAHEMNSIGELNEESKSRLNLASEIFFNKNINAIITSGWNYRKDCPLFIADVFKMELIKKGIASKYIFKELKSKDTVGDAFFIKKNILRKKNWNKVLVVTSDYHVDRTKIIFDFILGKSYTIDVVGSTGFSNDIKIKNEKNSLIVFNTTFKLSEPGDDKMISHCLTNFHPFYKNELL